MKEGCLFVLFVTLTSLKPWRPYHALDIVEKPLMNKGAMSWFHNVYTYDASESSWILNNFVKENSTKLIFNNFKNWGKLLWKALYEWISIRQFHNFKT
jgi:hypothetical protein